MYYSFSIYEWNNSSMIAVFFCFPPFVFICALEIRTCANLFLCAHQARRGLSDIIRPTFH